MRNPSEFIEESEGIHLRIQVNSLRNLNELLISIEFIFIFILYKWKMKSLCRFAANRLSDTLTPFSRQTISHFRISSFQNSIESTYSFHSYFSVWISQSSFVPNFKISFLAFQVSSDVLSKAHKFNYSLRPT